MKGCTLTKIGSANASIPFQFPTKEQDTLTIEGVDAHYGREARQPLKGCALTKIGSANASIPFQFPTKEQGTLTIEGVDAHYAKAIPTIP